MKQLLLLLSLFGSACVGEIDGSGNQDPAIDPPTEPPPPPPSDVRVAVRDVSGPLPGLAVLFMTADDAVAADVVTDAQGLAIAKLPDGGSVTVIREDTTTNGPPRAVLYTYIGVEAGDHLQLALPSIRTGAPLTVRVMLPETAEPVPVDVRTPCGSGRGVPPMVEVTLDGCGAETDFYVTELAPGGEPPAAFIKRAPIAALVDLSAETYRAALTTSLSVANAPSGATVTIEKQLETDRFRPVFSTGPRSVAPDQTVEADIPDLPGTEQLVSARVSYRGGTQVVGRREPYAAVPGIVDLAAAMILTPSNPVLVGDILSWTETGSGAPDLVLVELSNASVARMLVAPYTAASLRIPRLPQARDAFNVRPADAAALALAKTSGGFDAVRARVFTGPLAPMGGAATVAFASGTAP